MPSLKIKKTRTIYFIYWFLLTYIVAALVWWFIALNQQNASMTKFKIEELNSTQKDYQQKIKKINEERKRKSAQYIGEGVTFLLLIVMGAVFVFRAVRRQFRQSQQQQNFMMAITHELKTPIAVTKLNLETLQKHKLNEEQQQRLLLNTLQEANRLNSLCNNLLLASQIESGSYRLINEDINISELMRESIQEFSSRFYERKIKSVIADDVQWTGDRLMLQMAVNNLLDNAIKYSSKEEKIFVELKVMPPKIKIKVADTGNGVPDDEKENIFKKFYRAGNAHTRAARGTGLGLYVTKKIVEQHHGRISVYDNEPSGSIFKICLKQNER